MALLLLTRIPVPFRVPDRGARSAWAWPLAGLAAGGFAAGAGWIGAAAGLPDAILGGVILTILVVVTGALHEDGLADVADGFWGGFDRDRRLEIMRDSRIGSYGVIALALSLGLRWTALAALVAAGGWAQMVAASMLSRVPMAAAMQGLAQARPDGLSHRVGRPGWVRVLLGAVVAFLPGLWLAGPAVCVAAGAVAVVAVGIALVARDKIGGQTGDVLGAMQQVSEIAALAAFVAML